MLLASRWWTFHPSAHRGTAPTAERTCDAERTHQARGMSVNFQATDVHRPDAAGLEDEMICMFTTRWS